MPTLKIKVVRRTAAQRAQSKARNATLRSLGWNLYVRTEDGPEFQGYYKNFDDAASERRTLCRAGFKAYTKLTGGVAAAPVKPAALMDEFPNWEWTDGDVAVCP